MLEYSGILLLLKLEKMNIKPIRAYFQVNNSCNKFSPAVYWSILFTFYLQSRRNNKKWALYCLFSVLSTNCYWKVHCSRSSSQRFSRTDVTFFCVFPCLFLVFNLIYWYGSTCCQECIRNLKQDAHFAETFWSSIKFDWEMQKLWDERLLRILSFRWSILRWRAETWDQAASPDLERTWTLD